MFNKERGKTMKIADIIKQYDDGLIPFSEFYNKIIYIEYQNDSRVFRIQQNFVINIKQAVELKQYDKIIEARRTFEIEISKLWKEI